LRFRSVAASLLKMWRFRKSIEEPRNNRWPARRTSGGCAARRSPMWTESWRACGEILHNSANHAVRLLNQPPTRPDVATTSRGLTIGTIGRDLTIATMGRDLTTTDSAPPLPMIATRSVWNGVVVDHQRSRDGCFSWERAAGLHLGGRGLGPVSGKAVCRACMAGNSSRLTRALRSMAGGCAAEEATSSIALTRPLNQTVLGSTDGWN
jgi:hypothetical protein